MRGRGLLKISTGFVLSAIYVENNQKKKRKTKIDMRRIWCLCWGNNTGGLYGAEKDAEQWATYWRQQPLTQVVLLRGALTLDHLTQTVRRLQDQAAPEDLFFFSYSGHGYQRPRVVGQGPEERDGKDEVWYLTDGVCLRDHELLTLLHCPTKALYYWLSLDCCHVGLAEDLQRMSHLHPERWCVLSACMEHQSSQEALSQTGYIMGAFTAIVLEVLALSTPKAPRNLSALLAHPLFQERRAFLQAFGQTIHVTSNSNHMSVFSW